MLSAARFLVVIPLLAGTAPMVEALDPAKADLGKREEAIEHKRFPQKIIDPKMAEGLTDRRFPITRFHTEFNSIGRRRAPIEVREAREKKMIRPEVLNMKTFERKMAAEDGRLAYVRNFDRVRENELVPALRDADVVTVKEMSRPARNEETKELSMRDINRFTFQRNHSDDGPVPVQKPAPREEKSSRPEG